MCRHSERVLRSRCGSFVFASWRPAVLPWSLSIDHHSVSAFFSCSWMLAENRGWNRALEHTLPSSTSSERTSEDHHLDLRLQEPDRNIRLHLRGEQRSRLLRDDIKSIWKTPNTLKRFEMFQLEGLIRSSAWWTAGRLRPADISWVMSIHELALIASADQLDVVSCEPRRRWPTPLDVAALRWFIRRLRPFWRRNQSGCLARSGCGWW